MIKFGIEQEIVFKDKENRFLDFTNTSYIEYQSIIEKLPFYENDLDFFECKSLEKMPKRWYVEGIEIYNKYNQLQSTLPKAIEIRTTPHTNIKELVNEFSNSFNLLSIKAKESNLFPVLTSNNPFKKEFNIDIAESKRTKSELLIAKNSMITFGLHLNISFKNLTKEKLTDIVEKLNYYTPFIIPLSFSSCFLEGKKFKGLSYRNYRRAKNRKLINIKTIKNTDIIEFRAFDSISNKKLLYSIINLVKDIILNPKLTKRLKEQDSQLIEKSSLFGFENDFIKKEILEVLSIIEKSFNSDKKYIKLLKEQIHTNSCSSKIIKKRFDKTNNIIESISNLYNFN